MLLHVFHSLACTNSCNLIYPHTVEPHMPSRSMTSTVCLHTRVFFYHCFPWSAPSSTKGRGVRQDSNTHCFWSTVICFCTQQSPWKMICNSQLQLIYSHNSYTANQATAMVGVLAIRLSQNHRCHRCDTVSVVLLLYFAKQIITC